MASEVPRAPSDRIVASAGTRGESPGQPELDRLRLAVLAAHGGERGEPPLAEIEPADVDR